MLALPAASAACSATIDRAEHAETEFAQVVVPVAGPFMDLFKFFPIDIESVSSVAVSNNLPGSFAITEGDVDLWNVDGMQSLIGSFQYDGSTGSTSSVFADLGAGNYEYRVSGVSGSQVTGLSRGLYSLTASLNPIILEPAPGLLGLLAIGIALVGLFRPQGSGGHATV